MSRDDWPELIRKALSNNVVCNALIECYINYDLGAYFAVEMAVVNHENELFITVVFAKGATYNIVT